MSTMNRPPPGRAGTAVPPPSNAAKPLVAPSSTPGAGAKPPPPIGPGTLRLNPTAMAALKQGLASSPSPSPPSSQPATPHTPSSEESKVSITPMSVTTGTVSVPQPSGIAMIGSRPSMATPPAGTVPVGRTIGKSNAVPPSPFPPSSASPSPSPSPSTSNPSSSPAVGPTTPSPSPPSSTSTLASLFGLSRDKDKDKDKESKHSSHPSISQNSSSSNTSTSTPASSTSSGSGSAPTTPTGPQFRLPLSGIGTGTLRSVTASPPSSGGTIKKLPPSTGTVPVTGTPGRALGASTFLPPTPPSSSASSSTTTTSSTSNGPVSPSSTSSPSSNSIASPTPSPTPPTPPAVSSTPFPPATPPPASSTPPPIPSTGAGTSGAPPNIPVGARPVMMASPPKPPSLPSREPETPQQKLERKQRLRNQVAMEVMTTEQSYVESLEALCDLYITPMTTLSRDAERVVLDAKDIPLLFSNIALITQLNQKFKLDIEARLGKWSSEACIADLFLEFAPFFKMYTQYVSNHDAAIEFLKKQEKENKRFNDFVAKALTDPRSKGNNLNSYLIMPIQRIPRYKLLIEEMLRNTEETHADYAPLTQALEKISSVAKHINEAVHQQDNRAQIMQIQSQFTTTVDFISPSRKILRQGQLVKKCRASDKEYTFFLFNDLLVYASKTIASKYKLHQQIPIDSTFNIEDLPDSETCSNGFQILNSRKSFIVYAPDEITKSNWLRDFATACEVASKTRAGLKLQTKDGISGSGGEVIAPVWQSDHSRKDCECCEKPFTFTNRRHHCRKCGGLVCASCSTKKMRIKSQKDKAPQRVCDKCVAEISQGQANAAAKEYTLEYNGRESTIDDPSGNANGNSINPGRLLASTLRGHPLAAGPKKRQPQCKALYPYQAAESTDLTFPEGAIITIISKDVSGWWRGSYNGAEGLFPANYIVEVAPDGTVHPSASNTQLDIHVRVVTPAPANTEVELQIAEGDIIHVSNKDSSGYYYGTNISTQASGWFQSSHVIETTPPSSTS